MTTVTAVLVCHEGARWLPRALEHLASQTRRPDQIVLVDTASSDATAELARGWSPPDGVPVQVVDAGACGFGAAVGTALAAADGPTGEWVWLLHDDTAADADALRHLLDAAELHPDADVLGPKIREWPSLRRLLEIGVTISATGRREAGLERGEYDQGQHDDPRRVLAVGTAGMLVRRTTLERLGFDDRVDSSFADLDFGWRANRAGHVVRTVPRAVVFHAEGTRTGRRHPDRTAGERRRREREGALFALLANIPATRLPFAALRLLFGGVLRALGLVLVRAPGEAAGEIAALARTYARPWRILAARRDRRGAASEPHAVVRPLLPPWWTPYRHGLDEAVDLAQALVPEVAQAGSRRRAALLGPVALLVAVLVLATAWAGRDWWGSTAVPPALLPAPESAKSWWQTYVAATHSVGAGSHTGAPAYLLPMALLATLLFGSAHAAVTAVLLLAVPLAAWGGYRFLARWVSAAVALWGGAAYAVAVAISGAHLQGRLGTLVAAAVLPWLASSAADLLHVEVRRRRRAVWRTALWLALSTAFAPVMVLLAVPVAVAGAVVAVRRRADPWRVLSVLPVTALLALPWVVRGWVDHGPSAVTREAGLAFPGGVAQTEPALVLAARAGEAGAAPAWISAGVLVAAVLALLRRGVRARVLAAWGVALAGVSVTGLMLLLADDAVWLGLPLLVSQGALVTAAALAVPGLRQELGRAAFGPRQVVGIVAGLAALLAPTLGLAWWATADAPAVEPAGLPRHMADAAEADPAAGTLVLTVEGDEVLYDVRRSALRTLGTEALRPDPDRQAELTRTVTRLVAAASDPEVLDDLAGQGVEFVVMPAPVDSAVSGALDATPGLAAGGVPEDGSRTWRSELEPAFAPPDPGARSWMRTALVAAQLLAIVVVIVLALPDRRAPDRRAPDRSAPDRGMRR